MKILTIKWNEVVKDKLNFRGIVEDTKDKEEPKSILKQKTS